MQESAVRNSDDDNDYDVMHRLKIKPNNHH